MEKQNMAKHFTGKNIFALVRRMGSLVEYTVTPRGTFKYTRSLMSSKTDKAKFRWLEELTGGRYHRGRPTAENIDHAEMAWLCQ